MAFRNWSLTTTAVACGVILFGCSDSRNSVESIGEATMLDRGIGAATERYIGKFKKIDLHKTERYRFQIKELPQEWLVFGFRTQEAWEEVEKKPLNEIFVSLQVTGVNDSKLIESETLLSDWYVSGPMSGGYTFLYCCRGLPHKSGFKARPDRVYTVSLEVDSRTEGRFDAELVFYGGGWKQ